MEPVQGSVYPGRPARAGGTLTIIGAGLAVVALVVGVICAVQVVSRASGTFLSALTGPVLTTPVDRLMDLSSGRYLVYERTGTRAGGGGVRFTQEHSVTLTPDAVAVIAPNGVRLAAFPATGVTQTVTRGNAIYTGAVRFDVPAADRYEVQIDGGTPAQVIVAPSIGSGLAREAGWAAAGAACLLAFLLGVVLLVIGLVRRSGRGGDLRLATVPQPPRAGPTAPAAGPPTGPGPGWYPDPQQPGRMRYWDGSSWTGHTH